MHLLLRQWDAAVVVRKVVAKIHVPDGATHSVEAPRGACVDYDVRAQLSDGGERAYSGGGCTNL